VQPRGLALDSPERVAWACAVLLDGPTGRARIATSHGCTFGGEAAAAAAGRKASVSLRVYAASLDRAGAGAGADDGPPRYVSESPEPGAGAAVALGVEEAAAAREAATALVGRIELVPCFLCRRASPYVGPSMRRTRAARATHAALSAGVSVAADGATTSAGLPFAGAAGADAPPRRSGLVRASASTLAS
jgi:hypothetical protein